MVGVDVKHNNTWKTPTDLHVKHNGVWKNVITTHAKHDGVWKPIFSTPPTAVLNVEARPAATSPTPDTKFLLVVLTNFLFLFIISPFNSVTLLAIISNSYYNFIIFVINSY